jgi:hypothetical protein
VISIQKNSGFRFNIQIYSKTKIQAKKSYAFLLCLGKKLQDDPDEYDSYGGFPMRRIDYTYRRKNASLIQGA